MTGTSLVARMAERRHLDVNQFYKTIKNVMPKMATDDQLAAFLMVADRYGLDPITREIYAFPGRGGGITPVLSIDGWIRLVNEHPQSDGFEFKYAQDSEGKLASVTCIMHRKDREHPTIVTELLRENWRDTEPWRMMPSRMLRHKAFKEAARYCFGFAGVTDEDEARDIVQSMNAEQNQMAIIHDLDAFAEGRIGSPSTDSGSDSESLAGEAQAGEEGGGGSPQRQQTAAADDDLKSRLRLSLRLEAIDRFMKIAADKSFSIQDRLTDIAGLASLLNEEGRLSDDDVRQLERTAIDVAENRIKPAEARKHLEKL